MKKLVFVFLFITIVNSFVSAQLAKGTWMVGGNAGFTTGKYTAAFVGDKHRNSILLLAPSVGYFLAPKLPVGFRFQYSNQNATTEYASNSSSSTDKTTSIDMGPFARYYFLKESNKLMNVFMEANYGFGFIKYDRSGMQSKYPTHRFALMAGPIIFFNDSVGLEFTVGYYSNYITMVR